MMKSLSFLVLSLVLRFRNAHSNLQFCVGDQQLQVKDKYSVSFPMELVSLEKDSNSEKIACQNGMLFSTPIKLEGVASLSKEP